MFCLKKLRSAYFSSSIYSYHLSRTDPLHAGWSVASVSFRGRTSWRIQQHILSWQRTVIHTHRKLLASPGPTHLPWTDRADFWQDTSHNHLQRSANILSSYLCSVKRHDIHKETQTNRQMPSFIMYCYPFVLTVTFVGLLLLLLLLLLLWLVLLRLGHKNYMNWT